MINWGHPEKKRPHRGWLSIKVTTQLKTSENSWEHWKTSKITWYHPEYNWGLLIDNLVQFEEDFNSLTEMWFGPDGYLRPDQFLDHLTVIKTVIAVAADYRAMLPPTLILFFSFIAILCYLPIGLEEITVLPAKFNTLSGNPSKTLCGNGGLPSTPLNGKSPDRSWP